MEYKYKDYVKRVEMIKDNELRYCLNVDFEGGEQEKSALVIMQNPSKADEEISDRTVNKVLEVMHMSGYGKCCIMNLVPYYATNSIEIKDKVKENPTVYKKNVNYIKQNVSLATKIFVAWGGKGGFEEKFYQERIKAVKKLLKSKTVYCYKTNVDKTPTHPSRRWKSNITEDNFEEYKWGCVRDLS